jgi:glycine/serine hydroxymethyltransferase
MREAEMANVAQLVVSGIAARGDADAQERVRAGVAEIVDRFPVPGLPWTRSTAGAGARA